MLPLHPGLLVIALGVLAFGCPADMVAQNAPSTTPPQTSSSDGAMAPVPAGELPDSPGVIWAKSQATPEQSPQTQPASTPSDSRPAEKQVEKRQRPVGTAAAEAPKVSGVTAAQPAGAAIAPAKQRRVRTVVLKVGAILGAGAAIGVVVALSAATPSKPPGAH